MRPSRNRTARRTSDKPTVSSAFTIRHSPRATSSSIDQQTSQLVAHGADPRGQGAIDLEEPTPIRLRRHGTKRVIKVLDAAKDRVRRASRFELSNVVQRARVSRERQGQGSDRTGLFRQARTANSGTRGRSRSATHRTNLRRARRPRTGPSTGGLLAMRRDRALANHGWLGGESLRFSEMWR